jgi:hypothetical protein
MVMDLFHKRVKNKWDIAGINIITVCCIEEPEDKGSEGSKHIKKLVFQKATYL